MKEIIYPNNIHTINFSDVEKMVNPIIGFQKPDGTKITLVHTSYDSHTYFARILNGWENGNGHGPNNKFEKSIKEWCEFFGNIRKVKMFLFDSPQELFKWLGE